MLNNILNLLTRTMPILHEARHETLARRLLWDYDNPNYSIEEFGFRQGGADRRIVIYKQREDDEDGGRIVEKRESFTPYALRLMQSLMRLCFKDGYTIKEQSMPHWAMIDKNETCKEREGHYKYIKNRNIVLNCILACIAQTLYQRVP